MNVRMQNLKTRAEAAAKAAREVSEKAARENRNMTADEKSVYDSSMTELNQCLEGVKAAKADQAIYDQAAAFGAQVGRHIGADDDTDTGTRDNGRRLKFGATMAKKAAAAMLASGAPQGEKAVAPSGATVVAQEFAGNPVALGRPATSLLDVLPVNPPHSSPKFFYLRQNRRDNKAAVVPEGQLKPTSVLSVEKIDDELAVIAHLSEGVPRFWITDNVSLEQWLNDELEFGIRVAVESLALTKILGASGVQVQAYDTSPLVTLRKSLTKLEAQGYTAGAFVLHANDWEAIELLLTTTNAVEHQSLPFDPITRRLFGVPVVTSLAATAGTAATIAEGAAALDIAPEGVQVLWSENSNADDFSKNLIRARCEGRFQTSVYTPMGVVKSTLKAA